MHEGYRVCLIARARRILRFYMIQHTTHQREAGTVQEHRFTVEPTGNAEMLIRKPVKQLFEAFIDPEITSKFWFTKGSGRLEAGRQVKRDWEMYNVSVQVNVLEIEENKRILIEWQG